MENLDSNTLYMFLRSGDRKAFELIYKKYYSSLVTYAHKFIVSLEDRQEIANEIFMALHKHRDRIRDEDHLRRFLYVSTRNSCINFRKSKRDAFIPLELEDLPAEDNQFEYEYLIRAEVVKKVHQAIDNLPDVCGRIFKKLFYEGLKPAQIAAEMNIPVNNIYVQKNRAIQLLRLKIGPILLLIFLLLRMLCHL